MWAIYSAFFPRRLRVLGCGSIDSAFFTFNKGSIDFGKFTLRDKYNNKASVRGILYENAFQNMRYDFDMSTDKLLLLDTKAKDNQQFYGKAIGKAIVSLKGPQENMQLNILGETNDTTHIYIPPSVTRENSEADFIVFKKYGKEITEEKSESDVKLNINLDLTANENAQIDVDFYTEHNIDDDPIESSINLNRNGIIAIWINLLVKYPNADRL